MDEQGLNKLAEQLKAYENLERKLNSTNNSEIRLSHSAFNNTLEVNMKITVPSDYNKQVLIESLDRIAAQYNEAYKHQCKKNIDNVINKVNKIINKEVKDE